jgi:hypothetical protein
VPMGPSFWMRAARIVFKVTVPVMEVVVGTRTGLLRIRFPKGRRITRCPLCLIAYFLFRPGARTYFQHPGQIGT